MSRSLSADGAPVESAPRTAGDMLRRGREFLVRKGFPEARLDAELLVAHALGIDRLKLFLALDRPLASEEVERGRELLSRRARQEPVAYITGTREFYGRPFAVDPSVLIPRPETELLIDLARAFARGREGESLRCLDVGTGSGAIAISLALELASSSVVACDLSAAALATARANAERLGAARVQFVEGDGPRAAAAFAPFDLVLSNPPYIAREASAGLPADVRDHEPALALFAPAGDPHHWLRRLLDEAPALMAPGGRLLIEIGFDQGDIALEWATARGHAARVHRDFAKQPRVLEVDFPARALRAACSVLS